MTHSHAFSRAFCQLHVTGQPPYHPNSALCTKKERQKRLERTKSLKTKQNKKRSGGWYKICRIGLRTEGGEWCVSYSFVTPLKKQKQKENLLVWIINVPGLKQSNLGSNHFDLMNKLTCSICIISSHQKRAFVNSDIHIYTCKQDTYLRIRLDYDKRRFSFTYSVPCLCLKWQTLVTQILFLSLIEFFSFHVHAVIH